MYENKRISQLSKKRTHLNNIEQQIWMDYSKTTRNNLDQFVIFDQAWLKRGVSKNEFNDLLNAFHNYGIDEFVILNEAGSMEDFYNILQAGWGLKGEWVYEKRKVGGWRELWKGYRFVY